MNKNLKAIIKVKQSEIDRINALMRIDDFEVDGDELKDLGYEVDSTVDLFSAKEDGFIFNVSVCTGQTNAWIEYELITPEGDVITSEPSFEPIDGEYLFEDEEALCSTHKIYNTYKI